MPDKSGLVLQDTCKILQSQLRAPLRSAALHMPMAPQTCCSGRLTTAFMISGTYCFTCAPMLLSAISPVALRTPSVTL